MEEDIPSRPQQVQKTCDGSTAAECPKPKPPGSGGGGDEPRRGGEVGGRVWAQITSRILESCKDFGFSPEYLSEAVGGLRQSGVISLPLKRTTPTSVLKIFSAGRGLESRRSAEKLL